MVEGAAAVVGGAAATEHKVLECSVCESEFTSRYLGKRAPVCPSCYGQQRFGPTPCSSCGVEDCQVYPACYVPAVDPKTPPPGPNPNCCSQCRKMTRVNWTYNPYAADVGNTYIYDWWCKHCFNQACDDV